MNLVCPSCKTKNRVPDAAQDGDKYRCGRCAYIFTIDRGGNPRSSASAKNDEPDQQHNKEIVFKKIEVWKKQLLDLTRRNRLLHFRASRTSAIEITSPSLEEIYNRLVIKGNYLSFSLPKRERQLILEEPSTINSDQAPQDDFRPGDLDTRTSVKEVQSSLYRLKREWKTWQEEQGLHTLFLTVGMLHWYESEAEQEESRAPIFLVPVGLEKEGLEKPYIIHYVDEDIIINPTLYHKLDIDFDIQLPELAEEPDWNQINEILNLVAQRIPDHWEITHDVWLARFSFDKFVMYRDLDDQKENASAHPLIRALANVGKISEPPELPSLNDMDNLLSTMEVYPVLNADSSQLEALIRARSGQNLIIQGPPGTGKSQTIVNLIAQFLREKKKILFVSEKMAALEVVFKRLKEIGLSFACLEVHSHRSNKSLVIEELGKILQQRIDIAVRSDVADQFDRLIVRREILNQYVKELHRRRGAQNISTYKAHGMLSKYADAPSLNFSLPLEDAQQASLVKMDDWITIIRGLAEISEVWDHFDSYPWAGDNLDPDSFTLEKKESLLDTIKSLKPLIQNIDNLATSISSVLGIANPLRLKEVDSLIDLLRLLGECKPVAEAWFAKGPSDLHCYLDLAQEAEEHSIRLFDAQKSFDTIFMDSLLALPVGEILARFRVQYRTIFRRLKKQYRKEIKKIGVFSKPNKKLRYRQALDGLEITLKVILERNWYKENELRLAESFGRLYKGAASSWETIKSGIKWIDELLQIIPGGHASAKIIEFSSQSEKLRDAIKHPLAELVRLQKSLATLVNTLSEIYKPLLIQGNEIQETPICILKEWLGARTDLKALDDWISYLRLKAACVKLGLEAFADAALAARIESRQLENAFLKRYWKSWVSTAYKESPQLNEFRGQRHEQIIKEYQSLDEDVRQATIRLIQNQVQENQPKRYEARAEGSQVGILLKEVKRKRHRSLRRLFSEISELLQALKPCLLMSPLSVAAYLGKSNCQFDVIIFDEASQIPPEDAIGAILRGKQLIVAGDNKQLPPTKFFQAVVDYDFEEEKIDEIPLESILDECSWLPSGIISTPLKWHYRSKHEELIAFSNRRFYDNNLITFPSPFPKGYTGAVQFVYVPDAVYDRGGTRTNRIEARKTIDLVCEHLRSGVQGSIGIITLGLHQEEAILQEWEKRRAAERELASMVQEEGDEPFFIKALERVQGDERDFIFLSIGFGPDQNRIIHMQFGPINAEGGERRLNVAITRARQKMTVICSMQPQDLDLTKLTTGYKGVLVLQKYLEYAINGGIFREETTSIGTPESDFEISVKEAIEAKGYKVDAQVGFSGFRIDLGIRHPDIPNRYILGVECDGATYHSHRTARDRDRLRQDVLSELGWKIHRIWSTDWIKNPEKALSVIIQKINELRLRKDPGTPSQKTNPPNDHKQENSNLKNTYGASGQTFTPIDNPPTRQISFYRHFIAAQKKPSHWLYEAEINLARRRDVYKDILSIINLEGPIHFQFLCSRVREIYNLSRAGSRVQKIVNSVLRSFKSEATYKRIGDFFHNPACKIEPRAPSPGENPRPIECIAVEELAAAVECVIKDDIGISRDALIRGTAQIMGYERTGINVQERINEAIEFLLKEGKISESNNQIVLKKTMNIY